VLPGEINHIAVDPADPDTVYVSVYGEGVYKLVYTTYLPLVLRNT
jgi:hypothetical protein